MNLKDLFAKGENGALTFDQFQALCTENKVKAVDLSEGGYVSKQKYDDDLAQRDTRITGLNETIATRDTDLANLQAQIAAAGGDKDKLDALDKQFKDLQSKYDNDTKSLQDKLQEQAYKHAVDAFAVKQKFTSQAAKRDFISAMLAKKLTMENDTIMGANDFVAAYTKDNADAFAKEEDPAAGAGAGNSKPQFAGPTGPNGAGNGGNANPFQFDFSGVRPHNNK